MQIRETDKENLKIFSLKGRLDSLGAPSVEKKILSVIEQGEKDLIIDIEEVNYISSAGVRALVLIQKEVNKHRGSLQLIGVSKNIENVFHITGFLPLFTIVKKSDVIYTSDKD